MGTASPESADWAGAASDSSGAASPPPHADRVRAAAATTERDRVRNARVFVMSLTVLMPDEPRMRRS